MTATSKSPSRNAAFDRARTFLTLVVLLHHAVIPYTHYGHSDSASWIGFDVIVLATDSFFMAMFFFLSGLFVWPGLSRKPQLVFLRDRLIRLALPGALGAIFVIPLAYYALALRQSPGLSFPDFWWKTVTVGPWPSGPIWFIWVLLAFDTIASFLYRLSPQLVLPINRLSRLGPLRFWLFFAAVTEITYVPLSLYFGNSHWLELGPFSVQTSRILLYASYFLMGAGVGAQDLGSGLLSRGGSLAERRWSWAILTISVYALMWLQIYYKRGVLGNPAVLPWWYQPLSATLFGLFSASILFAILGFFLSANPDRNRFLDRIQGEAYGIFLVHYPIVLWIQYFLLDSAWPAVAKATTVFVLGAVLSWAVALTLRKIPGATRVL